MTNKILVLDYGMGNLLSVKKKLSRLQVNAIVSADPKDILQADKIILPGVGHFEKAMENLKSLNLLDPLNEAVLIKQKPILGICLGMQLMSKFSEEGNADGLSWFDAHVVKFNIQDKLKFKIPHTGWNSIAKTKNSRLMEGIDDAAEFYFVHSYHMIADDPQDILNETSYEYKFTSAIEKNNIFGVQYHPEKSHDIGEVLFKNFIQL